MKVLKNKRKLQFKNTQNPLLRLVPELIRCKHFKVKPIKVDEESETERFEIEINNWQELCYLLS